MKTVLNQSDVAAYLNPRSIGSRSSLSLAFGNLVIAILSLLFGPVCHAQRASPPVLTRASLVGGGFFSAFNPGYGPTELYGSGGFLDLNVRRHFGAEGEIRFLRLGQSDQIHEDNYAVGVRYRWQLHRYEPYGKFLLGNGQYNFPFNYGHGGYLMVVPGGGLDIHWRRFTIRAIDYESQHWVKFLHGRLGPDGVSVGVGYRVF